MPKKSSPAKRKSARKGYEQAKKKPLGEGSRFSAMEKMMEASGMENPAAAAAAVGRKKYGAKRMAKLAATGRKKKKG